MKAPADSRSLLRRAALAFTAFVIYGSLVPLDFQTKPLDLAWGIFLQLPWAVHAPASLTDWITNVVIYLPLAVLWRSALRTRRPEGDWLSAGLVWLGCLALSAGLEFAQIFMASRTPLFNDVLMNGLGAGIGILLWPVVAPRLAALADAVSEYTDRICPNVPSMRMPAGLALLPYLGVLGWANGWFTSIWLSPQSALERLAELHLVPFYQHYFADIGFALRSVGTVLAAYAPLGLGVWALRRRACSGRALLRMTVIWSLLAAGLFESSKLFLADRQPDYTNLLFAVMGGWLGCILVCACRSAPSAKVTASREVAKPSVRPSRGGAGWRVIAVLAFGLALYGLWSQPFARIPLAVGALLYVGLLLRYPHAWLILVPGLLPVLDLAPWSGRFFFDEFDLMLLLTLAVGYGHLSTKPVGETRLPPGLSWVLGLFAISCLISLALALFPLAPLDLNSFAHYYSPYNALRVAKGFFWALALLPLLIGQLQAGAPVGRLFALGMAIGLAGAVLAIVWERAVFPGLTDFTRDFRAAGLMSSMHTGGSSIEAFLVLAMPFLAAVVDRKRSWTAMLAGVGLLLGGLYALAVTYARGGYVAMGLVILVLAFGWMLRGKQAARMRTLPYVLAACLLAALVVAPILGGQFAQSRLAQSEHDAGVRMAHWQNALAIRDEGWRTELFGMGLGRYPITYFYSQEKARSATFSYFQRGGQRGLSLGAGTPLYVEQKVSVRHEVAYQLQVKARSASGGAGLNVLLCERTFFDSFGCTSATFKLADSWSSYQQTLALGWPGGWGRPVTLSLENFSPRSVAEVESISLRDPSGRDVISNGDFSEGADRWFFSTFDHLGWHIKNLWVSLLFEQGWLGLLAFISLCGYALTQIARHFMRSGDMVSLSALAGLVGILTVGAVDSLFDAPRLTLLFFLTLLVGRLHGEIPTAMAGKRVRRASSRPHARQLATRSSLHRETVFPDTGRLPIFLRDLAIGVGLLAMLGLAAKSAPGIPYNLREVIYRGSPILSALMLSLFWFWLAGVPMLFARGLAASRLFRLLYLPITVSHAAVAAGLILMAAPSESIHDLVGSPVLGWPGQIESMARLTALFAALSVLLSGGAWMAGAAQKGRRYVGLWAWGACAMMLLMLAHWVVVERAATDNLTELMAGGGGIQASISLSAAVLLLGACGSLLSLLAAGSGVSLLATLIWALLTLLLSFGFLVLGLEMNVLKYGQSFSALQFLLSTDRANLASGMELALRYGLASCAGLLALAFAQWPFSRSV